MLFRSVFLKTLRDYWVAILGWGVGMGLTVASPKATVDTVLKTPAQRQELLIVAQSVTWNAEVTRNITTIGGYATFKIGMFILLIVVWPLLAGSRTLRGEEERGSLDALLALPRSRVRVAIEKVAAIWVALLAMGVLVGLIAYAAGARFGATFSLLDGLAFGFNLALVCALFAGIALLISQFTEERSTAAGWTATLLVVFIVVDMVHRVTPNTDWFSALSPIYYFNMTKPLVPSYGVVWGAWLLLFGLTLLLTGAAIWLFARRDVGGVIQLPLPAWLQRAPARASRELPAGDPSLGSIYARSLGMIAWPTAWWSLGVAAWGAMAVWAIQLLEKKMEAVFTSSPQLVGLVHTLMGNGVTMNAGLLGALLAIVPILLMAFAVTQVNSWTGDEQDGRLEMVLATPQSRPAVLLGRFAALATAVAVISLVGLLVTYATSSLTGFALNDGNLVQAMLGVIPMALLIASIGYLAAGWLRTAADTGLLSFLLAGWFFLSFIGPELNLPNGTLRLSAFYYYGNPILNGLNGWSMSGVLAVSAVALGLGTLRFARKDIPV